MIGKLKDFVYDFNDIVVAIVILAVAAGVITWRVADIMAYPEYLASQQETLVASNKDDTDVDFTDVDLNQEEVSELNDAPDDSNSESLGTQEQTSPPPVEAVSETKITIPAGSYASKVADILFDAGLITSSSDFLAELTAQKADTKLKAGTFTIPAGSTPDEIIAILIK